MHPVPDEAPPPPYEESSTHSTTVSVPLPDLPSYDEARSTDDREYLLNMMVENLVPKYAKEGLCLSNNYITKVYITVKP